VLTERRKVRFRVRTFARQRLSATLPRPCPAGSEPVSPRCAWRATHRRYHPLSRREHRPARSDRRSRLHRRRRHPASAHSGARAESKVVAPTAAEPESPAVRRHTHVCSVVAKTRSTMDQKREPECSCRIRPSEWDLGWSTPCSDTCRSAQASCTS
jgi:hypothetical protein